MTEEELQRMIDAAQDYNQPPETPREEMWAVIRTALPGANDDLAARRLFRSRERLLRWTPWGIGLAAAATLAVGFGLGRLTMEPVPTESVAAESGAPSLAARVAAAEHMSDAEALLTMFRADGGTEGRAATVEWAQDLLATTRILLDSRVAEDPEMASLLSDLELVLVQIANAGTGDHELIEEGIRQQQLLAKLRTAAAPAEYSL